MYLKNGGAQILVFSSNHLSNCTYRTYKSVNIMNNISTLWDFSQSFQSSLFLHELQSYSIDAVARISIDVSVVLLGVVELVT